MKTVAKKLSIELGERLKSGKWGHGDRFMLRHEISKEFDVSPSTVSNALKILSNQRLVKTIPGKGIFVIDPSRQDSDSETAPPKKAAKTIGLIGNYVPPSRKIQDAGMNMVSGQPIISGIWSAAVEQHCNLVLLPNSRSNLDISQVVNLNIGGVIVLGGFSNSELIKLRDAGIPAISANCPAGPSPCNYIDYDNTGMIRDFVDRVTSQGHRHIGFMAHSGTVSNYFDWLQLHFIQAQLKSGVVNDWQQYWQIGETDLSDTPNPETYHEVGVRTAAALLDLPQPPSVIFCYQPSLLSGLDEELQRRGLSVPDDISIVTSYNFPEHATYSGYNIPHIELGHQLLESLRLSIENPRYYVQKLIPRPFMDRGTIKKDSALNC